MGISQINIEGFTLSKEEQIQFLKFKLKHHKIKEFKSCKCGVMMLNRSWNILCSNCLFNDYLKNLDLLEIKFEV